MLRIEDINLFKITKVKPWAIYFTYDNERYLLHGSECDYESDITLYKRDIDNCGKYTLEQIHVNMSMSDRVEYLYLPRIESKTRTYSSINKEKFIKLLTYDGFCESIFNEEIKKEKYAKALRQYQINDLEDKIRDIRKDMDKWRKDKLR